MAPRKKGFYYTHFNGERPYKVLIVNNNVSVFENDPGGPRVYSNIVQRVFIGKSPLNETTEFSGGHGPRFDGNSFLFHEEGLTYVFVGEVIRRFTAKYPIVTYVSPVGNNDVPYPYAIDESGRYYLLIENVVLFHNPNFPDPYRHYYSITKIPGIRSYVNDGEEYDLEYSHDYIERAKKLKDAYLVRNTGTIVLLDPEIYVEIMELYAREMGIEKINGITFHQRR